MEDTRSHSSQLQPELELKLQIPNLRISISRYDHFSGRDEGWERGEYKVLRSLIWRDKERQEMLKNHWYKERLFFYSLDMPLKFWEEHRRSVYIKSSVPLFICSKKTLSEQYSQTSLILKINQFPCFRYKCQGHSMEVSDSLGLVAGGRTQTSADFTCNPDDSQHQGCLENTVLEKPLPQHLENSLFLMNCPVSAFLLCLLSRCRLSQQAMNLYVHLT